LLPESDGILYFNFKPMRAFFHKDLKPPQRVEEYQQFIDAIALIRSATWTRRPLPCTAWRTQWPQRPGCLLHGAGGQDHRPAAQRLAGSARPGARILRRTHNLHHPSEGRLVRVAQIGYDMLAVSNTPTPEQIHSMLDRHATAAWPFAGSTMLRQHFHDVQLLSLAWEWDRSGCLL